MGRLSMFENFISLGCSCGTAASMAKIGIRSTSGPFDWCISDLDGVLNYVKNDFEGFLDKNRLKVSDDGYSFRDIKNGIDYLHDIDTVFENDYENIYKKYMRRVELFQKQIRNKTCFIRIVKDDDELIYVKDNLDYINEIIKKYNHENEIIYVVNSESTYHTFTLGHPFYAADFPYSGFTRKEIRSYFDSSLELQNFIISNFDENVRNRNMVFDLKQENQRLELPAYRYEFMEYIDRLDANKLKSCIEEKIIIYGAGRIGKRFYKKVGELCEVLFFVDADPKTKFYNGIRVVPYDEFKGEKYSNIPVIVTPCYDYRSIRFAMIKKYGDMNIIPVTGLFQRKYFS